MELKDLVVTPIVILIVYLFAYWIRPRVTDKLTRRYFIPGLTVKIIGAIALGFIYQFYYGGGDTFSYYTHGSVHIWEAFLDSPIKAIQLIFADGNHVSSTFKYSSQIWFFRDPPSYFVVRVAGILGILSFNTYSSVAALFAAFSFSGMWPLFCAFYKMRRKLHFQFALSILFVPSVFFWGSGILKDTIAIGALGWLTFAIYQVFFERTNNKVLFISIVLLSAWLISIVKIYILICFAPALLLWLTSSRLKKIRSIILRIIMIPIFLVLTTLISYLAVTAIGIENSKYSLDNIAETTRITAYDIRYYTGKNAGSGYSLGDLDGSFESLLVLAPAAINVSLFRPYLWEVSNFIMVFASLESTLLFIFTIYVLFKVGIIAFFKQVIASDLISFTILFALSFSFAVGVSTYNFGTLIRYKIPMTPFLLCGLFLILHASKKSLKTKL